MTLNNTHVKIGYHSYQVLFVNGLEDRGSTELDNKVIKIDSSLPLPVVRDTLLHEILHVLLDGSILLDTELRIPPDKLEEHLVLLLTPSLLLFFQDNPEMRDFLLG